MNGPKMTARVLQILPADGWRAVWAGDDGEPFAGRLVCWALVDVTDSEAGPRDGEIYWPAVNGCRQSIVGMTTGLDGDVDSAESASNFIGYAPADDDLACWEEKARDYAEHQRRRRGAKP